jgi:hypothetical protein
MDLQDDERPRTVNEIRPRRWFQFDLATAIILMFAAGGCIWLNVISHKPTHAGMDGFWRGFPYPAYITLNSHFKRPIGDTGDPIMFFRYYTTVIIFGTPFTVRDNGWCYEALIADVAVSVVGLLGVGLLSEFILRRREERRA